jgi:hypothetical protein
MCTIDSCKLFHTDPKLLHSYIPIHFLIEVFWKDKHGNDILAFVYIPNIEEPHYEIKRLQFGTRANPEDLKFRKGQLRNKIETRIRNSMYLLREKARDDVNKSEIGSLARTFKYKENEVTECLLAEWNAEGLIALADDPKIPETFGGLARRAHEHRTKWDENRARLLES